MKFAYYLGAIDRPSPGRTNVKVALDLNYYALRQLWRLEDYKVGWLFRMVEERRILRMNKERARAKERSL
jgi:hypothetical protein